MEDQVAVAALGTCNFALLERKDPAEIKKLLDFSISAGFFYLDFTSSQVESLPEQKGRLLEVMKGYFSQPMETKMLDSRNSTTRGFVSKGSFSAVDPNKSKESFEHLAIASHELYKDYAKTLPKSFQQAGKLVPDYISSCEHVVDVLLDCYSIALGLEGDSSLSKFHNHHDASDTILALLSYPGQLTHQKHTDIGSLTVLFSDEWGLQVVAPETRKWEWIEVRKYQAVINVGDTLRFFSDKKLYSCLHRVVREGRAAGEGHRYSIAYLLRPNDAAVFRDADGMQTTSKDFVRSKYQIYSASHSEQKGTVLTGGMEQVLGVEA